MNTDEIRREALAFAINTHANWSGIDTRQILATATAYAAFLTGKENHA